MSSEMTETAFGDNSDWMTLVSGTEVQSPRFSSVEDVAAYRSHPSRDLRKHNVNLPSSVDIHTDVLLRNRGGVPLTAEIYTPKRTGSWPMLLYMHGGGWCWGKAEYVRKLGMSIAERGHVVVNLDYGLAPEYPFPWAVEDVIYAARWMVHNGERYRGEPGPIAIGGASSGANLAAAAIVALTSGEAMAVDDDRSGVDVRFSACVFLYGIFDFPLLMQEPGTYVGFAEMMFNLAYLGPQFLGYHRHPLVSPALAPGLGLFPPAYLITGDRDSLLPQSLSMAQRLIRAGVPTTLSVAAGLNHSFAYIPHQLPAAAAELNRMFEWLGDRTGACPEIETNKEIV